MDIEDRLPLLLSQCVVRRVLNHIAQSRVQNAVGLLKCTGRDIEQYPVVNASEVAAVHLIGRGNSFYRVGQIGLPQLADHGVELF